MNAQGIDTDMQTIEPILGRLIKKHGLAEVRNTLARLQPQIGWIGFQRIWNATERLSKRKGKQ